MTTYYTVNELGLTKLLKGKPIEGSICNESEVEIY